MEVATVSYNGSGTFQINTSGQPVVAGTVISATAFNALTADLATGLSTAITKDGQTTTTARIPFAAGISSTLTTDSSSVSTGSIITSGGVGIAKALYVGTTANVASTTDSSSITTGSIVTAGGVGVAKNLYVGVNANVAGTLGVTGVATFSAAPIYSSLTASSAVATDASKGLVSVTNTGTGNNVLATSPTLVTPILGAASATSITVAAGTVSDPAITTTGDTNTGIFFPAADTIAFAEGGAEAMRIDSSGNVGIGTSSPAFIYTDDTTLTVNGKQSATSYRSALELGNNGSLGAFYFCSTANAVLGSYANIPLAFRTNNTERMRIDSSGNLLLGTTTLQGRFTVTATGSTTIDCARTETTLANQIILRNGNGAVGSITTSGTTTAYNTSSDYRLKDNPQPLLGSGAFIDALQPKTWSWKVDGSAGVGFLAHEAQAVSPSSVAGEKDAVDENGKPIMQAMEYGSAEFIANIIAELQSLRVRVAALEAK